MGQHERAARRVIDLPRRGELRWALVPYVPQAPFRSRAWGAGVDFEAIRTQLRQERPRSGIDLELRAAVRPVLLLHDWEAAADGAYVVLRTKRIEALPVEAQPGVRAGDDTALIPLAGIHAGNERAAMIGTVTRLHVSAIDSTVLGTVADATLQRVAESMAAAMQLDLDGLVQRRVDAVLAELGLG